MSTSSDSAGAQVDRKGWRLLALIGGLALVVVGLLRASSALEVNSSLAGVSIGHPTPRALVGAWFFVGWHTLLLGGVAIAAALRPRRWTRWALLVVGGIALADAGWLGALAGARASLVLLVPAGLALLSAGWLKGARKVSKDEADIAACLLQHVELWKYFESRGMKVKDTMFQVVTWILGLAALVLGFTIQEAVTFNETSFKVTKPSALLLLSGIGLLVVLYALILIRDFSDHINRNFDRADRSRDTRNSLLEILDLDDESPSRTTGLAGICRWLLGIVLGFEAVFLYGVYRAAVRLLG